MHALTLLIISLLVFDDRIPTPAHTFKDGRDYHPTNKYVLFGHHFAATSGAVAHAAYQKKCGQGIRSGDGISARRGKRPGRELVGRYIFQELVKLANPRWRGAKTTAGIIISGAVNIHVRDNGRRGPDEYNGQLLTKTYRPGEPEYGPFRHNDNTCGDNIPRIVEEYL